MVITGSFPHSELRSDKPDVIRLTDKLTFRKQLFRLYTSSTITLLCKGRRPLNIRVKRLERRLGSDGGGPAAMTAERTNSGACARPLLWQQSAKRNYPVHYDVFRY